MEKESGGKACMPMGFAVSIAEDPEAVRAFFCLSDFERSEMISRAREAVGSDEMAELVREITRMGQEPQIH